MITFDDVRKEQETTYVFFPDCNYDEVRYFFHVAHVPRTEYTILTYDRLKAAFPSMAIPKVPIDLRFADVPWAVCTTPCLIVSKMNKDDLTKKLQEIHESDECVEWNDRQTDAVMAEFDAFDNEPYEDEWVPPMPAAPGPFPGFLSASPMAGPCGRACRKPDPGPSE